MNDDDLMTAVREEFAPVRMDVAADTIMARGRAARRLRRSRVAAGVLAVGLGAGLGIPALMSGNATGGATLAAWTVARQTDGSVTVTIREMRNLPALQAKLAADGARLPRSGAGLLPRHPSGEDPRGRHGARRCHRGRRDWCAGLARAAGLVHLDGARQCRLRVLMRPVRIIAARLDLVRAP